MTDQEFLEAVRNFGAAERIANLPAPMAPAAIGGEPCKTYKQARPLLVGVLPILKAIPGFGPKLAEAIQSLINIADAVCGGGAPGGSTPAAPGALTALMSSMSGPLPGEQADFIAAASVFTVNPPVAPAKTTVSDFCKTYKELKPILQKVLPFLSLIPVYGPAVGAAITALMAVLDDVCK